MRERSWGRALLLILAAFALVLASCASDDDSTASTGGGGGDDSDGPATCQGATGEDDSAEALGGDDDPDGSDLRVGMVFDIGGKGDKSFNDSAFAGLEAAAENMDVDILELEPAPDGSNREALVRQLADEDYGLIVAVGFAFAEVLDGIAADYPDTEFAIIDSVVEADNVTSLVFAEEEGSFLVGAAAAQATGTGTIGFVGGVENELIKKFEAGYVAGAEAVNEDIAIEIGYLSPDGDFSGFDNSAAGQTTAAGQYSADADVVYHAAGQSGIGVFSAAEEADRLTIGVDSNQYLQVDEGEQACMLTSMLKRVDVAVYSTIVAFANDELDGGVQVFDLANDGIGYATQGGQIVDEDALEDLKQQIIDGDIDVPDAP